MNNYMNYPNFNNNNINYMNMSMNMNNPNFNNNINYMNMNMNNQNIQNNLFNFDELNKELFNAFMNDKNKYNYMISTLNPSILDSCCKRMAEMNKYNQLLNNNNCYNNEMILFVDRIGTGLLFGGMV